MKPTTDIIQDIIWENIKELIGTEFHNSPPHEIALEAAAINIHKLITTLEPQPTEFKHISLLDHLEFKCTYSEFDGTIYWESPLLPIGIIATPWWENEPGIPIYIYIYIY